MAHHIQKNRAAAPETAVFRKTYSAVIRSDGTLLPIEERLGRRLLRSLAPESREARHLLQRGCVNLTTSDGRELSGLRIEDVYERLSSETSARLTEHANSPEWQRSCREALANIERRRRALAEDH